MHFYFDFCFFFLTITIQWKNQYIGCGRMVFSMVQLHYYLSNKAIRSLASKSFLYFEYTELDKRKSNDFYIQASVCVSEMFTFKQYMQWWMRMRVSVILRDKRVEYERTKKTMKFYIYFFVFSFPFFFFRFEIIIL